jgi:nucleoside-diphosphate-sugar epimerase
MRALAWLADNAEITRDFGWQPQIDIEQGFAKAYRWYRQRGWL